MARDPLYHDARRGSDLDRDQAFARQVARLHRLKLASGLIALALVAAIWLVWRWG
jgi:hypothetical protein